MRFLGIGKKQRPKRHNQTRLTTFSKMRMVRHHLQMPPTTEEPPFWVVFCMRYNKISELVAFQEYLETGLSYVNLATHLKIKYGAAAYSSAMLQRMGTAAKWPEARAAKKAAKAVSSEEKKQVEEYLTPDNAPLEAKQELRAIAAHTLRTLRSILHASAHKRELTDTQRELLKNSANVQRLVAASVMAIEQAELLVDSGQDKAAETASAAPDERYREVAASVQAARQRLNLIARSS